MSPVYVYEVYDAEQRLIYVGSTNNIPARLKWHSYFTWWAPQAAKVRATVYRGLTGRIVEKDMIRELHPRWNAMWQAPRREWTAQHYYDELLRSGSSFRHVADMGDERKLAIWFGRVGEEYIRKFGGQLPSFDELRYWRDFGQRTSEAVSA